MKVIKPKHTTIKAVIKVDDGLIILESYSKYPQGESNLYKVDDDFNLVWVAPLLGGEDDSYSNIWFEGDKLKGFIGSGSTVTIDPLTGQLSDIEFTK